MFFTAPSVVACDVFPPMAALAERLTAASPYGRNIRVVNMRSDELMVADSDAGAPLQRSAYKQFGTDANVPVQLHGRFHWTQVI